MFLCLAEQAVDHAPLLSLRSAAALGTLTLLEIVLGIDNIVFLAILTGRLRPEQQKLARRLGLGLALLGRIVLLLGISWVMGLTDTLFTRFGQEFSGKDLILIAGGVFLLAKATVEIYHNVEGDHAARVERRAYASFGGVIAQIVLMDMIFSLDSVITAVGMSRQLPIMVAAIVLAMIVMVIFAEPISAFVERHPSIKILALAFLVLIGVLLVAEGFEQHISRGYIYSALVFSLIVEMLQLRMGRPLKARNSKHK